MKTMTQRSRHFAPRTPAARRAFTLLELLVAATITALLAGFLAVVVGDVAGFWSRTSGRLTTEAQARIVLDQLTLDLQSAHFEDDGNTWLAATVQNAPGGIPNWISNDQNPARAKPATSGRSAGSASQSGRRWRSTPSPRNPLPVITRTAR